MKWKGIPCEELSEPPINVERVLFLMKKRGIVPPGFGKKHNSSRFIQLGMVPFNHPRSSPFERLQFPREMHERGWLKHNEYEPQACLTADPNIRWAVSPARTVAPDLWSLQQAYNDMIRVYQYDSPRSYQVSVD